MNSSYPSARQSFNIIGLIFGCMIITSPILFAENLIGKEASFLLYYMACMGVSLAAMLNIGCGKIKQPFQLTVEDPSIVPFIIFASLALTIGVVMPVVSLIPIPDFFKKVLVELGEQDGLFGFLAVVVAAPILEELIFRGVILDGFLKRYSPVKAILLSSFLFGFIHLNPWQFLAAGILGIFMGWIYYRTRSVALTIVIHFVNNLAAFVGGRLSEVTIENIDESIIEQYGGVTPFVLITGTAIVVLIGCVYYLNQKMESKPETLFADPSDETPSNVTDAPSASNQNENDPGEIKMA